ncbi:MAG: hypothetical protein KGN84_20370 [Acidobacteriota bacterium]|nr:hypothetical protein [Acidobacteriota bacterium]
MNKNLVRAALFVIALQSPLLADRKFTDCGKGQGLNAALQHLSDGDTLMFTGVCRENVSISTSGIVLIGQNGATIAPPKQTADALTVSGAQRVTLQNITVQNGINGLHLTGGASVTLQNITAQSNAVDGMLVEGSSSAYIAGSSAVNNGLDGLDVENTSSAIFNGNFLAQSNLVFGINLGTTSSATVNAATVTADQNTLGIQVSVTSSWFLSNPGAAVVTNNNATVGLTVVSGSHLFAFGGTISTSGNGLDGFDIASRSGMDLDAGTQATANNNLRDGIHAEELCLVNLFNNPQFSGNPAFTAVTLQNNAGNGISLQNNSQLHMFDQARIIANNNTGFGIQADNGSSMTLLNSTIQSNPTDVNLTFASRGEFTGNTIGTLTCDATSLIRGDTGTTCPH